MRGEFFVKHVQSYVFVVVGDGGACGVSWCVMVCGGALS